MADARFLIGDIGGTNIRLATVDDDPRTRSTERTYKGNDPKTAKPWLVIDAIRDFESTVTTKPAAVCMGVAGRVRDGQVQITNRPDLLRDVDIAAAVGIAPNSVLLVNDMPPHLAAVDKLLPSELVAIKPGRLDLRGTRAVLMPGTGVGVGGALFLEGTGYLPFPSEGGHLDFAPRDEKQDRLLRSLRILLRALNQTNVSNEFAFCGEGIRRIYACLRDADHPTMDGVPKAEEITTAVAGGKLPASDLQLQTIDIFLQLLGAAAGNLAMLLTATGGVYLGGSICLSLRSLLATAPFLNAYRESGPPALRSLLDEVPIRLIDYKDSGLLGTAVLAQRRAR